MVFKIFSSFLDFCKRFDLWLMFVVLFLMVLASDQKLNRFLEKFVGYFNQVIDSDALELFVDFFFVFSVEVVGSVVDLGSDEFEKFVEVVVRSYCLDSY